MSIRRPINSNIQQLYHSLLISSSFLGIRLMPWRHSTRTHVLASLALTARDCALDCSTATPVYLYGRGTGACNQTSCPVAKLLALIPTTGKWTIRARIARSLVFDTEAHTTTRRPPVACELIADCSKSRWEQACYIFI
jgi:hypothetical protein